MSNLKYKNKFNKILIIFTLIVLTLPTLFISKIGRVHASPETVQLFQQKTFSYFGDSMKYNLYLPQDYNADGNYRLVLFLHGAGDIGDNCVAPLNANYGFVETLVTNDLYKNDTIILVPQCPTGYVWVDGGWATGKYTYSETPSYAINLVKKLTDQIANDYAVNKNKIYACGVSMGGMAVWDLIARYPKYFAAAAPICGAVDESKFGSYMSTPIFTCNDQRDKIIKADPTVNVYNMLNELNCDIVYKNYDTSIRNDNTYHSSWIDAFSLDQSEDNIYNFMFSKDSSQNPGQNGFSFSITLSEILEYIGIFAAVICVTIILIKVIKMRR